MLLVYPFLLLLITFWGCSVNKDSECNNIWDRDQTKMIQAAACLGVVLHHLTQMVTSYGVVNKGPVTILSSMGILFTSIFFFFSGYGLFVSVTEKEGYLKSFLWHRMPTILVPFIFCNILAVLIRVYYNHIPLSKADTVKSVFGIILLNGNGWYIVEIFWIYLIFYFYSKNIKNKDVALFLLAVVVIGIIRFAFKRGQDDYFSVGRHWFKGEWWYNSTIVFIMGLAFARFKTSIVRFAQKHYYILVAISSALFIISFAIEERILKRYGYYHESFVIDNINGKAVTLISQMIVCIIFTWLILLLNIRIRLNNKILRFLGVISMEIFLTHGLFINNIFDFSKINEFTAYFLVIVCGITAGFLVHKIDEVLLKIIFGFGKSKDEKKKSAACNRLDKRKLRTAFVIVLVVIAFFALKNTIWKRFVQLPNECKKEMAEISKAQAGDEVNFGRIETDFVSPGKERIIWIVLKRDDDYAILISKDGLFGSTYNNHHAEVNWEESDIRKELNNEFFEKAFSEYEKEVIIPEKELNDKVTLLTVDEALEYYQTDVDRQTNITSVAKNAGTNINSLSKANNWDLKGYRSSWWWLKGDNEKKLTAPIVSVDGEIIEDKKYVNKPNGAVKPVIRVSLKQL